MSHSAAFLQAQVQLTTWTDELEFLSYILCELIDAERLGAVRHNCHQAADFPALSKIIRLHIRDPSSSLARIMSEDELTSFRRLLKRAGQIRNLSAHHDIPTTDRLGGLKDTKQALSNVLEIAIKRVASYHEIAQVSWSPCHHIYQIYTEEGDPLVVGVPLTEESLLLFRDRTLREQSHRLSSLPKRRRKHKSTQASRKKQEDDYNAAQLRRQRRTEQHLAVQTDHFLMRL